MSEIHGFELVREEDIQELNITAKIFRHIKTGAELISMQNDDENKVFGVSFPTLPDDSTGVPHILEHAVLGGSRKYPVKEPFIELYKGSLQTFVNAWTFSDKTVYPVASQNLQDFYNLADVYLDAVFYPNITPETLQQEGWHYEYNEEDDSLAFHGVVFNEMKGAFSSPEGMLGRYSEQSLFPDNTYGVESGGDPQAIPDLTYEQFKNFYNTFYHPSNALIWFYGDDPVEPRLKLVNEYLQDFDRLDVKTEIPLQEHFDEPIHVVKPFEASEDGGNKAMMTVNWLFPEPLDPFVQLSTYLMSHILMGTAASPLRKALIDSGLGEDTIGGGLESQARQMYFSTGLKGIAMENVTKVEDLIFDTLQSLVENGIEPEMIEASLNTIEFRLRENNTGSFPRGLVLMVNALSTWLYGGDPLATLAFEEPLNAVKSAITDDPKFFENMIKDLMIENSHRSTVVLEPTSGYGDQLDAKEKARLEKARAKMSDADIEKIKTESEILKKIQNTPDSPEALATIPRLTLADLDRENKTVPIEISTDQDAKILYHDLFTNGIIYLNLGFDLHNLPQGLLPYIPLFGRSLTQLGTKTQDFVKLSQRIGSTTGGISTANFISAIQNSDDTAAWFFLNGKATMDHADDLLGIMSDVLLTVNLDNQERFLQIALEDKAMSEAHLVPAGHQVAYSRLKSHFSPAGWIDEQISGVSNLFFVRELVEKVANDWSSVLEKLETIRSLLLNRVSMICNVTLDADNWADFQPQLSDFLSNLPSVSPSPQQWQPSNFIQNEGLTIPAQVNYVGKGTNLYDLGYELDGSVGVISKHLSLTHLWEKIRVMGGAYGAFNSFDAQSGTFAYVSYRDPNLTGTLANYDTVPAFLRNLDLSQEELTGAIIGAISNMDQHQLPDAKGYSSMIRHLINLSDEERQLRRDEVLSTTVDDFHNFANILEHIIKDGHVVVVGSQQAIEAANKELGDNALSVTKVL